MTYNHNSCPSFSSPPPADIEVACYGYEGIDAVKEALRAGLGCSTEAMPIKVILPLQPLSAGGETLPAAFTVFFGGR